MTAPRVSSDSYTTTVVRLPERELAEVVLELAQPVIEKLGTRRSPDDVRAALELVVTFWNASVLASRRWERPSRKALTELKRLMRGRDDLALFDVLTERWRPFSLDPRLVESWTYELGPEGTVRLVCGDGAPRRRAGPRTAAGGEANCDRWRVPRRRAHRAGPKHAARLPRASAPCSPRRRWDRDRLRDDADGAPAVADGRLPRIGGGAVEVAIGGRALGPMVLTAVRSAGESHDTAVLVFAREERSTNSNA